MARTTLTPHVPLGPFVALPISADAADITFEAQTGTDGWDIPANNGRYIILVRNDHAADAKTVTITSVARNGRTGDQGAYSLAAGDVAWFGPFDRAGFNQSDGAVDIEGEDTNVVVALLSLGSDVFPNS